ncbi:MAG TPA: magnesium transporter CorA family protein [Candidatus Saccharimonadales bacterium]|nr:magnesium transporter CorA family protein [Candidatus Saccharimonadales bacterium]
MIKYFFKSLRGTTLEELADHRPGCWVYAEAPNEAEVNQLVERFKLDPGHITDSLDEDEMPRLEREGELTYIFIRYAYTDDELQITTAPLLFVVGPDLLLTISLHPLPRLQRFLGGKLDFATTQRTKLVLQIFDQIVDQYEVFVNNISRQIKMIRQRLKIHDINNQDFIDFVQIEDELNEFLSAMSPTTAILRRLMLGKHIPLFPEDQDIVEDLLLNNEQSIESCRSNVKSIVNIRESYSTIMSNNLNRSMKILTALTLLIALPNTFFGLYGMNVILPFQHANWAFFGVTGLAFMITLIVLVTGRRNKVF